MNVADRLALIRSRCRRDAGREYRAAGMHVAAGGEAAKAKRYGPIPLDVGREWGCHSEFGILLNPDDTRPQWVNEPDEKPEVHCETKRRRWRHHLTVIAEKWASERWREETKRLDLYHA